MLCVISSTVGIGCLALRISSLALRMSMQRRMSPPGFGTTTIGFTHGVGPSIGSMMSRSTSSFILFSTFDLKLKGVLRIGCAMGLTSVSMCSYTVRSFNLPTPLNTCGYFCCNKSPMIFGQVLTAATSTPIFNTPRVTAVSLSRRDSPLPLITQNSALTVVFPTEVSQRNVPITSSGACDAYV